MIFFIHLHIHKMLVMKRIISLSFVFAVISIFLTNMLNAQTTEKKLNEVVVKKSVVERSQMKQAPVVKKTESVQQNSESIESADKTSTNSSNSQNSTELKKCQKTSSTTSCSKKCTTPCHQVSSSTSTDRKPVPKF
jgi:hypothetical protein